MDGSFNFGGSYMSNAHGWASGPGGALTESVLGISAVVVGGGDVPSLFTSFVVAPQTSGLKWCVGRLSFAANHKVDVQWNVTRDSFTLLLNLENAHPDAKGSVELPLFEGENVEIEVDGVVVAQRSGTRLESTEKFGARGRHVIEIPNPLVSHVYVVRRVVSLVRGSEVFDM